jgi:hypothetical protein
MVFLTFAGHSAFGRKEHLRRILVKTPTLLLAAGAVCTAALWKGTVHAAYSDPVPFNRPGYTDTQPWDINDSGTIVGRSDGEGFVFTGGVFSSLVHPDATNGTYISGVANDGTLVGSYWLSDGAGGGAFHGFIYSGGAFTPFDVPGSTGTSIRHVSSNGRYLSGTWSDESSSFGFAYDLQAVALTTFGASDFSTIVQGVNSLGQVTGSFFRDDSNGGLVVGSFVFDLTTGTRTEYFQINGLQGPRFRDINDSGVITGFVGNQALVGTPGNWQFFPFPTGVSLMTGYGLNEAGTVVGYYSYPDNTTSGWISSPVPEPGTWVLMALGLGMVARRASRGAV